MENIEYLNNEYDDCETINLNAFNNNDISFDAYVRVPHNTGPGGYVYTYGTLTVWYNSGSAAVPLQEYGINDTHWTYTDSFAYLDIPTIYLSLDYSLFDDTEGGGIFIVYHESIQEFMRESCENQITFPKFSISPENVSLNCGDDSEITFYVENENNTPGELIYVWNVGSGWLRDGEPVSYFETTTSSVTLQPVSFPPSDVKVEPEVVNGENFQQLISSVTISDFNPNFDISGDNYVCDTGIYAFNNLPNGISIQSVSTSNPNIATATLDGSTGEITVTKVADGIITLSAVLQNSCNQTATQTKENIQIGLPSSVFNATITGNNFVCQGQNYTYTLSGANHPCVSSVVWSVSSNLNIVSQDSNTITVSQNIFDNQYAGLITASIPGTAIEVEQGVWVGVPSNAGLTIQKIGTYDFYVGTWTQLKANFTPLTYEANDPLDVTFEWQIPNSMVRNYADTAYKDVNPNSSGQLTIGVRAVCDCGNGEWSYRTFEVDSDSGGGGNELTPID